MSRLFQFGPTYVALALSLTGFILVADAFGGYDITPDTLIGLPILVLAATAVWTSVGLLTGATA